MTSPRANESESRRIDAIEQEIEALIREQANIQAQVRDLLLSEDPAHGVTHHEDIFRLQQDKLRMDTEVQFLHVKLRRLKSTW